jgi:hypothetical protein
MAGLDSTGGAQFIVTSVDAILERIAQFGNVAFDSRMKLAVSGFTRW